MKQITIIKSTLEGWKFCLSFISEYEGEAIRYVYFNDSKEMIKAITDFFKEK